MAEFKPSLKFKFFFSKENKIKKAYWVKVASLFLLVAIASSYFTHMLDKRGGFPEPALQKIVQENSGFHLIKPLLAFEVGEKKDFSEYKPLEKKIIDIEDQAKASGDASIVSFYFRDLATGRWTGENENEMFSPGSLLKVPLMIAFFQSAEIDPQVLSKKLSYSGFQDANASEAIKPSQAIKPGQSYTVSELIKYMIVYSDNNATVLLFNSIDHNSLNDVLSDLGINYPENDPTTADFISAKQYSLFFRVLYNASYLNSFYSETALQLLSQVDYKDGIAAGLPEKTVVAHKFGERDVYDPVTNKTQNELHDCGIVYSTGNPYFICVMTKGDNLQKQQGVIKEISAVVYSATLK